MLRGAVPGLRMLVDQDHLDHLLGVLVDESVGLRRPLEGDAVRDEPLQAQPGEEAEGGLRPPGAVPPGAELRVYPPDLRRAEAHPKKSPPRPPGPRRVRG